MKEEITYLLREIRTITKDSNSDNFWLKAVKVLGPQAVEMELGELKYQMKVRDVKEPAKYLVKLLQNQIEVKEEEKGEAPDSENRTYLDKNQIQKFRNLKPVKKPEKEAGIEQQMAVPFSSKNIPWLTFVDTSFFTLSTNKKRSDTVIYKARALDGSVVLVSLTRGRVSPTSKEERGIPTVQHGKVFAALKLAWARAECKYTKYSNGTVICYVKVTAREVAKLLGWREFGGSQINWLKDVLTDLKAKPYHLCLDGLKINNLKGFTFFLLGDILIFDRKTRGGNETVFNVHFSSTVSYQLLKRRAVSRSPDILQIRNELAWLVRMYIEPIILSLNCKTYRIDLKRLIKELQLPEADWHRYPGHRKKMFEKAVKELNKVRVADQRIINVKIENGLHDWQLCACLKGSKPQEIEY